MNCIDEDFCLRNDIKFEKTSETATAAGKNCMILSGETCESVFLRPQQNQNVRWNLGKCVAVKNLGCDILIGEPAKKDNCIVTIAHKQRIFTPDVNGLEVNLDYATKSSICNIKSTSSYLCRVNEPKFLLPDEKFEFALPEHFSNADVVIAPRKLFEDSFVWPKPQLLKVISNKILIPNDTGRSITLKKSDHFADITVLKNVDKAQDTVKKVYDLDRSDLSHLILPDRPELDQHQSYIADIKIDPDGQLTEDWKLKFKRLCEKFSHIINPAPGKYNGYYGRVDNSLHFISTPAPVKARLPNYSHDKMMIQAREMDKMEKYGVLSTPEELGIVPLHVVPSMLVPKSEPGEYRVVSDFNSLNVHLKKPEVVLQTMEEIKRVLAEFEFHAELDLSNYYWQGGMLREDSRYLATPHPFGGLRVYTVEPQGLKGASEHGSERLARVYGDMEQDRKTIRHADGIYVLGNSPEEVHDNLEEVMKRAELSGLTFKPKKVIICPKTTQLFGWIKEDHAWRPTKHVLSPLASADKPVTVKQLRSWLGAFKQVTECIGDYATLIGPLEHAVGGKVSQSKVTWSQEMEKSFAVAKNSLKNVKPIHYPRPNDHLEFYPDYSEEKNAIGGWMKIVRPATPSHPKQELLGGHFSQRLSPRKVKLIPCEGEALAARCLIQHFRHSLSENKQLSKVFSDNLPICQAWRKMKTGIWSKSSKVASLLTNMSVYNIEFVHIAGVNQKYGDYNSRNPPRCNLPKCQICRYAFDHAELDTPNMFISKVSRVQCPPNLGSVTAEQIERGEIKLPFTEKPGWLKIQKNDKLHIELLRLITSGQTPEKKRTGQYYTLLKRMYNLYRVGLLKIDQTGLIVIRHCDVKGEEFDSISVPEEMYPGLVTAFHIKLFHPSCLQLQRLLSRYFFCLNSAKVVDQIQSNCPICTSLSNIPKEIVKQSTTPSGTFASKFSADVLKQHKQLIFICRENLSQYTTATILTDETADSIREAIIASVLDLMPEEGTTVRLDPAPGNQTLALETEKIGKTFFQILEADEILVKYGIKIDLGRVHNINKNPVAENAVKEFHKERLRLKPEGGPITEIDRCIIIRNINQRIRNRGLAAKEILLRRDLVTNHPKDVSDAKLSESQLAKRESAHPINEKSKATYNTLPKDADVRIGDSVYIKNDLSKLRGREQHLVVKTFNENGVEWAELQKANNQLRSKRYKLKLSEIITVPFGNNTVKEIPEIVFSQEVAYLHGFPPESTHPIQNLPSETPVGDLVKQQKIRAELIKEIEKEINRDKRRGRPARKKYPENSLGLPADFLDAVPGPSGIQCLTSKRKTMKHPPQYAFDYDEWQALLNLQVYEMNDIANDVNPPLILEDQVEENEIDVHKELERDITDQIENNPLVTENNTETDAEHEPSPATTAAEDMYSGVSEHDTTDTNVDDE